jgi:O-methyltransferase
MIDKIIKHIIVKYATNPKYINYTHEWIYVKKKQDFVKGINATIFLEREAMYDFILKNRISEQAYSFLEFGVYKGESLKFWLNHTQNKNSKFYGFDTFTGLPEDWTKNRPKGSYSANGILPDIKDERVEFVVGLFNNTLPSFLNSFTNDKKNIIHLDADLYSSTMYVLNTMLPYLKSGDILVFDEFGFQLLHEFKAFIDFISYNSINYKCIGATTNYHQVAIEIL